MSRHKIHNLAHGIKIQEYNNGSYAYWIEDSSYWKNIPAELGKVLVKELKPKGILSGAKSGKVIMGEMSVDELIKISTDESKKKQLEALAKEAQDLDMGYGKDDK